MSRRLGGAVAVLALALLVVGGCTTGTTSRTGGAGQSSSGSATPAPEPTQVAADPPPRPRAGTCHRLGYREAVTPTTTERPVRCRRQHTAQTWYVGTLDAVVDGHLLAVDSRRVQRQVAGECRRRLPGHLGTTPRGMRLTMIRAIWFSPTLEQSDAGADWLRCDVIALAGDERLAALGGGLEDALASGRGRDRYGICGTSRPGSPGFERVICSAPHEWRAIDSYDAPAGRYPGAGALRSAGEDRCRASARAQADDQLDYEWALDWPTGEQWRAGQRYGLCWAPD